MHKSTCCAVLTVLGLSVSLGTGCGKKTSAGSPAVDAVTKPAAVDTTPKLTGADEVRAALDKKDYNGAIAALLRVRQTIATREQEAQYMSLSQEVKNKLIEAYGSDPKAAEALAAMRAVTAGR